jgi:general secretion pathway protein M
VAAQAHRLPGGRAGTALAVALLLMLVLLAYLAVVAPLIDWHADRQAALEQRQALAERLTAAANELPALTARAAELRSAGPTTTLVLDGASDAIAAATLQGLVQENAGGVGAQIASIEALPAEPRGALRRIGLRVALNAGYETTVRLIAALEAAQPPLVIDNLTVHGGIQGLDAASAIGLDVAFEVYAFRSDDAAGAAKP